MRWCGGRDVTMWTRVSPDRILISAALIVQNEEKHIGRLLESLVGLADQVVAIDGGSFAEMPGAGISTPFTRAWPFRKTVR